LRYTRVHGLGSIPILGADNLHFRAFGIVRNLYRSCMVNMCEDDCMLQCRDSGYHVSVYGRSGLSRDSGHYGTLHELPSFTRLQYAGPACTGFLIAAEIGRLQAIYCFYIIYSVAYIVNKAVRYGFLQTHSPCSVRVTYFSQPRDQSLFQSVIRNPHDVLHHLLKTQLHTHYHLTDINIYFQVQLYPYFHRKVRLQSSTECCILTLPICHVRIVDKCILN